MADFGTKSTDYKPANVVEASGLIGKIAKQIVEHEEVPERYEVFNKEPIDNGKDIEITMYELATGKAYDPKGENPAEVPDPKGKTLILTEYIDKSYSALINNWDIAKAAKDGAYAADSAAAIVQTLYEGYEKDVNVAVNSVLTSAATGAPSAEGTTQMISIGDVPEVVSEDTARAVLLAIKTAATGMKTDAKSFNPYAFEKMARRVVLVIPYETRIKIDTYLYANTRQVDYVRYDVDEIVEIPAADTDGAIYVLDVRYVYKANRRRTYDEKPIFNSGGNVAAGLAVSDMIAGCPFFCAVKLASGAEFTSLADFTKALDKKVKENATAARPVALKVKTKIATVKK